MSDGPTALVTGSSGFLGEPLLQALESRYVRVDGIDIRTPRRLIPGRSYVADVREVLPQLPRYDAVFHLAASVGGRAALEGSPLGVATNLALDVEFFSYVARTRPAHAAYLSSSAVYPCDSTATREVLTECSASPVAPTLGQPDGTYGWVKLTGEHLAQVVRARFDVPVICYRPFTVYGPGQGSAYPITAIAARALAREDPIGLWGSGEQVRDLVFVDDAVAALVASHDQEPDDGVLNICTGEGTSFRAVAELAASAVGYQPSITGDPGRPAGVPWRVGAPDRLAKWYSAQTLPSQGLARVLDWLAAR